MGCKQCAAFVAQHFGCTAHFRRAICMTCINSPWKQCTNGAVRLTAQAQLFLRWLGNSVPGQADIASSTWRLEPGASLPTCHLQEDCGIQLIRCIPSMYVTQSLILQSSAAVPRLLGDLCLVGSVGLNCRRDYNGLNLHAEPWRALLIGSVPTRAC